MINAKLIFKILGSLLNIEAAFMTLCLVLSLYYRENDMLPLAITVGVENEQYEKAIKVLYDSFAG